MISYAGKQNVQTPLETGVFVQGMSPDRYANVGEGIVGVNSMEEQGSADSENLEVNEENMGYCAQQSEDVEGDDCSEANLADSDEELNDVKNFESLRKMTQQRNSKQYQEAWMRNTMIIGPDIKQDKQHQPVGKHRRVISFQVQPSTSMTQNA